MTNSRSRRQTRARDYRVVAVAAIAIAALSGCSQANQSSPDNQTQHILDKAEQAAEEVAHKADKAVDKMDDMADMVMASGIDDNPVAYATLKPVGQSGVSGRITFTPVVDGLQVRAHVSGLSPGDHGVHIHKHGSCKHQARAAGPNLTLSTDDSNDIHGNLGEFTAADNGTDTELIVLHVPVSEIMGKAVVVHADGNQPEQTPSGSAGARIACGIIQPTTKDK